MATEEGLERLGDFTERGAGAGGFVVRTVRVDREALPAIVAGAAAGALMPVSFESAAMA